MKKILGSLLLLLFSVTNLFAQEGDRPRMIVNIMIDGLRSDVISQLWNEFEVEGLRKIIDNGTYCKNVSFPYLNVGKMADYTTFFTGTLPINHGICADRYWDLTAQKELSYLTDKSYVGINSEKTVSPKSIESSTLADELRLNTYGKSKMVTVAIDAEPAVIMAGHKGKTVWIDDESGKWASSSFYSNLLPSWAVKANGENHFEGYKNRNWTNVYPVSSYKNVSRKNSSSIFFAYDFSEMSPKKAVKSIKLSPFANSMVRELAVRAVRDEYMGVDDVPDMLNIQFSVKGDDMATSGILTAETQDLYFRLDKEIVRLIKDLDELCGKTEVLYVVMSPQEEYVSPESMKEYGIPCGYFVSDRSMSLLSTYLMAIYGQGDFILGYYHRHIYLNKEEIKAKNLDVEDVEKKVAAFMSRFEGVQTAFRAVDMENINFEDSYIRLAKKSYNRNKSGDVLFLLKPGWVDVEKETEKVGLSSRVNNYAPLILYGWAVKRQVLKSPVSILDVAPTVCSIMQLPFPNANMGNPIPDVIDDTLWK